MEFILIFIVLAGAGAAWLLPTRKALGSVENVTAPQINNTPKPANYNDIDTLARTLWGEARGEGFTGMQAVANVVMNRVRSRKWPSTVTAVCKQKGQFSVWNANAPQRGRLMNVTPADAKFKQALEIAAMAVNGHLEDITGGADHYHTHAVNPYWSQGVTPIANIGNHKFFRLG